MRAKKLSTLVSILSVLTVFGSATQAESIYAITDHGYSNPPAKIAAYGVEGDEIDEQYTYELDQINYPTGAYLGPVGITSGNGYLFVTHENTGGGVDGIQLIDARTMLDQGVLEVTDSPDFAGIVYDHGNDKIYAIERQTDDLYVFSWDLDEQTLSDPNIDPVSLGGQIGEYGCGLALDETEGILYVTTIGSGDVSGHSERSNKVYCYDASDPNFVHIDTITIPNANDEDETKLNAVGVAVYNDGNGSRYLYTGAYSYPTGSHNYLVKIDLDLYDANPNDPNSFLEYEDVGASVTAIAVDQDTGLVYITTSNNQVQVWDTELPFGIPDWSLTDFETEGIDGPAGVCVSTTGFVPPFGVSKIADVNEVVGCITPRLDEEITYTISYVYSWTEEGDPNLYNFTQIYIEDHLPNEVDFVSADPNAGYYDISTHSYVWIITPENFGSPNSIDITVEINDKVTPGEAIENAVVEIVSDINDQPYKQTAEVETTICECGDSGKIICVDKTATEGDNNGTSWTHAYVDLQSALKEAFPCDQIWVADSTYTPEDGPNDFATFRLVNAVGVYGGFDGTETEVYERDWLNNETVLSGYIDPNEVNFVVTADEDIRWAILDGFTITRGLLAGVYFQGGSVLLEHNFITDNGIGILCDETQSPKIRNNWIYDNAIGMSFLNLQDTAIVRNNTVVDNDPMGVYCDSDIEPSIKNCIFWGHADANDLVGCYAAYSCIEYPTHFYEDPNETIYLGIGEGNIDDNPLFATGTYFLSSTSLCIDAGDPNETYYHQRDIDKQFRVLYGRVDMGADEYYDCDYVLAADFNEDGIVNFPDFGEFAQHWLKTDSDPNWASWVSYYDLAGDDEAIDVNDLALFADEWLLMDCDTMTSFPMPEQNGIDETYEMMMMSSGSSTYGLQEAQAEPTLKEQIDNAQYIIDFLERIWKKDKELRKTIDKKDWDEFIDKVYEWFYSLEDLYAEE